MKVFLVLTTMTLNALRIMMTVLVVAVTIISFFFLAPTKNDVSVATASGIGIGIVVPLLCGLITLIVIVDQGIGGLRLTENSLFKLRSSLAKMNIPRMNDSMCSVLAIIIYMMIAAILGGMSYLLIDQLQAESRTALLIARAIICIPAVWWIVEVAHFVSLGLLNETAQVKETT